MTTPEAVLADVLEEGIVYTSQSHDRAVTVLTLSTARNMVRFLHDAGYALTPLAPEVTPRRDGLREALESGDEPITAVLRRHADRVAWPHSGSDPAVPVRDWADRIDAALAATRTPEPPDSGDYPVSLIELPEGACGVMRLCERPVGHDGPHETSVDRAIENVRAEPPDSGDGAAWAKAAEEWKRNPPPLQVLPRDAGIDAPLLEAVFAEAVARGVIVLPEGNGIRSVFAELLEAAARLSVKGAD